MTLLPTCCFLALLFLGACSVVREHTVGKKNAHIPDIIRRWALYSESFRGGKPLQAIDRIYVHAGVRLDSDNSRLQLHKHA